MNYLILIIGMAVVTYLPRLLPLISLSTNILPPYLRRLLGYIPYTTLGALIIPGVFQAFPQEPVAVWLGMGAAIIAAWFRGGLVLSVLVSVFVTYLCLNFFG